MRTKTRICLRSVRGCRYRSIPLPQQHWLHRIELRRDGRGRKILKGTRMEMLDRLQQKRNDEGGFTLIELLIVIVILAILAAIVVFAVGTTTTNAKISACNADAKSVETAIEAYQ